MRATSGGRNGLEAVARSQRDTSTAGGMRGDDTAAHALDIVSNVLRNMQLVCTHRHVLFIGTVSLVLLLSGHDILNLADTLATHSSVWIVSLGCGEVVKRATVATSSASEVRLGCARTVVADQLVYDFGVTQSGASVSHQVRGVLLAVVGECSERTKAFTSLAPDSA